MPQTTAFYAYPSTAALAETIRRSTQIINAKGDVGIKTWEDCRVNGNLIIDRICEEIKKADLFCADVTELNPNVLFELGYAIAVNKRIWLSRDTSVKSNNLLFEKLKLLTTVGYASYSNADDIVTHFYKDRPFDDINITVFSQSINPSIPDVTHDSIFFLKSFYHNQANVDMALALERMRQAVECPIVYDDPRETASQSLSWYGINVYGSKAVICHLMNPARENSQVHNSKASFIAGMAYGFEKRLLILIEGVTLGPIDYRDILKTYQTASDALSILHTFLDPLIAEYKQRSSEYLQHTTTIQQANKLKNLRLGDPIAENESSLLVTEYFIETAAFNEARAGKHTIFVGRKGVGKSANLLKLNDTLGGDKRNLVCVIKPLGYDLQGLVELIKSYRSISTKAYALETIWKFLIYSEIANSAALKISQRPAANILEREKDIIHLLGDEDSYLQKDFTVRLERCVKALRLNLESGSLDENRTNITEILHGGVLKQLRLALGKALQEKKKIFVLIDNLDKAWDKQSDVETLTEFLLGLLSAANRIAHDFKNIPGVEASLDVHLCVFLRTDIFNKVLAIAREPDKIPFYKISWADREMLIRLVNERMQSTPGFEAHAPEDLWKTYFAETVRSLPVKEYIFSRTNQKPRDLLYLLKSALTIAVNRRHPKVSEADFLEAEKQYAQFALESILVENGITVRSLENIIFEFVGSNSIITKQSALDFVARAGATEVTTEYIFEHLCSLGFLGFEVHTGEFRFSDDSTELRKNKALAEKLVGATALPLQVKVNPAYWAYLETVEV